MPDSGGGRVEAQIVDYTYAYDHFGQIGKSIAREGQIGSFWDYAQVSATEDRYRELKEVRLTSI
ncbi:hypothetical protein HQ563_07080 [bacterium]|nr:hypothetical protein [bacterium]